MTAGVSLYKKLLGFLEKDQVVLKVVIYLFVIQLKIQRIYQTKGPDPFALSMVNDQAEWKGSLEFYFAQTSLAPSKTQAKLTKRKSSLASLGDLDENIQTGKIVFEQWALGTEQRRRLGSRKLYGVEVKIENFQVLSLGIRQILKNSIRRLKSNRFHPSSTGKILGSKSDAIESSDRSDSLSPSIYQKISLSSSPLKSSASSASSSSSRLNSHSNPNPFKRKRTTIDATSNLPSSNLILNDSSSNSYHQSKFNQLWPILISGSPSSSLVSAQVERFGRIAIKKQNLIDSIGLEAAQKAIHRENFNSNSNLDHSHSKPNLHLNPSKSIQFSKWLLDSSDDQLVRSNINLIDPQPIRNQLQGSPNPSNSFHHQIHQFNPNFNSNSNLNRRHQSYNEFFKSISESSSIHHTSPPPTPPLQQSSSKSAASTSIISTSLSKSSSTPTPQASIFRPNSNLNQSLLSLAPSPTILMENKSPNLDHENHSNLKPNLLQTPKNRSTNLNYPTAHHLKNDYSPCSPTRKRITSSNNDILITKNFHLHHHLIQSPTRIGIENENWLNELDFNRLDQIDQSQSNKTSLDSFLGIFNHHQNQHPDPNRNQVSPQSTSSFNPSHHLDWLISPKN
ncbi:hypothetical protein O181_023905 [Austropuccinia psidii MF-1]|uniref:Uncharacterized protein n=1 Tax=Austropuccinia psidii MF-1 TaxID=1389203 RepID=A0A9Q3CJH5_9BASI|nr:hypothetical protein [Austropuccinia psidii MF-1]